MFITTEEGANDIDCDDFPLCKTYAEVLGRIGELYADAHDWETVVIDSADWLEQLVWADVCQLRKVQNIADIGYNKGYTFALNQWRDILGGLDALREARGMNVILIAHAAITTFTPPDDLPYQRYSPRLDKLAGAFVQEWCDEVLFAKDKVFTKTVGDGFNKKAQGVSAGERVIYTTERATHDAKNRLKLPDELPLSWQAYAEYLPQKA